MEFVKFRRVLALALAGLFLSGCRDQTVIFEPACIAFSGDRITITADQYIWDRFTDARSVGDDGQLVDPYPDYPKTGPVVRAGKQLTFADGAGATIAIFHIHEQDGIRYLLRDEEYKRVASGGALAECALRQREETAKNES